MRTPGRRGSASGVQHVPETRFGKWFLRTETWTVHVLDRALDDLERLVPERLTSYPVVVDVGCGAGQSLARLARRFAPTRLVGVDLDRQQLAEAGERAAREAVPVELVEGAASRLPFEDASVDLLFCHQTFHHLVEQDEALKEFARVLKPGAILLFAESTRRYIESWIIRLLFRHPMEVQRTADEYLAMVRGAGFTVAQRSVSYPYLWWSRGDLGFFERVLRIAPRTGREETLINPVAVRR